MNHKEAAKAARAAADAECANGPFDADVSLCMTCGNEEATHEISIQCHKGLLSDYSKRKPVFYVNYSVCGPCARQVVEVKLAADLRVKPAETDNTVEALRAELKAVRDCAHDSLNSPNGLPTKEALRKISQGTVR